MKDKLMITDHALLRYMERIGKVRIDILRKNLLSKFPHELIDGTYSVDGIKFVVQDNHIVTILTKEMFSSIPPSPSKHHHASSSSTP